MKWEMRLPVGSFDLHLVNKGLKSGKMGSIMGSNLSNWELLNTFSYLH